MSLKRLRSEKPKKYARVLGKAKQHYANSLAGDFEVSKKTSPATFKHRRARFLKLRDA